MLMFRKKYKKISVLVSDLKPMSQKGHYSIDTEQSQELKPEKIRDITIVVQSSRSKFTGKFVFVLFCIGVLAGDILIFTMNIGSLYDKMFATITMLSLGAAAGIAVWLCNKYLHRK